MKIKMATYRASDFDIFDMQNPHPFYAWARNNQPIFFDEKSDYWVITKYQDVKNIIINEQDFSAELERVNYSKLSESAKKILDPINFKDLFGLSSTENPSHDKIKKPLLPIFHMLFKEKLSQKIEDIISKYIEKLKGQNEVDIIKEMFHGLPAEVIFTILGIPEKDIASVKSWSESRLALTWGKVENQEANARAVVKYWEYTQELIDEKLKSPGDDLPSYLLSYYLSGELDLHEIKLLCYGLIFSGHATTSTFLGESLKVLLETGTWNQILENGLSFSESADELLRLCPSAFTRRRLAKADLKFGNWQIRKGDKILLAIGSANRDAEIFDQGDVLDVERLNSNRHLSFGKGFHFCIGARLVKFEYSKVMEQLSQAFPNMSLKPDQSYMYDSNISIRSLKELHIILN